MSWLRQLKDQARRGKISKSNKRFFAEHGASRKIPVTGVVGMTYITMPKRKGFKKI